jgi:hypothetical protein
MHEGECAVPTSYAGNTTFGAFYTTTTWPVTKLRHAYDISMLLDDDATLGALRELDRPAMLSYLS